MHRLIVLAFLGLSLTHPLAETAPHVVVHEVGDTRYEFHASHHLLLAIGEACHVINVSTSMAQQLTTKAETTVLLDDINNNYIKPGTNQNKINLQKLRNMFHDLYANFQCIGKHVYEVKYTEVTSASSTSSAAPLSTLPSSPARPNMTPGLPTPMPAFPIPS